MAVGRGNIPLYLANSEAVMQLLLFQANAEIKNYVISDNWGLIIICSLGTITLYLMLMLEWSLMGDLMSGWVGVVGGCAGSYYLGSMCQGDALAIL
jgi:hypothetical protein